MDHALLHIRARAHDHQLAVDGRVRPLRCVMSACMPANATASRAPARELYPEQELTILDAGSNWIESHAAEHPALAAALEDGALAKQAGKVTMLWRRACEQRVAELRRSDAIRIQARACVSRCAACFRPAERVACRRR